MNRTIEYKITEEQNGLRVEQFLRRKGYSGQNLAEIKRMPKSVLVNGKHYYMRQTLKTGDDLVIKICEDVYKRQALQFLSGHPVPILQVQSRFQ